MNLLVTGATGFVGRHLVERLLAAGHSVSVVTRHPEQAARITWSSRVSFITCDLEQDYSACFQGRPPDALIHLAWQGLPDYKGFFHLSESLPTHVAFLQDALSVGVKHLAVAGTCLEYGLQCGALSEDAPTFPVTPYGLAKDTLRKSLELLKASAPFRLQWIRLFYMYGSGQNPKSVLAQLDLAIDRGDEAFDMSAGDQLRDYLPVESVAENIALAITYSDHCQGVVNCCSGKPISILDLVLQHRAARGSKIRLNRGHFPYPDYEPMAFWGIPAKLDYVRTRVAQD